MRGERGFGRHEKEREESERTLDNPAEKRGYERKIRDKIEEDPGEKHQSGFDPAGDRDESNSQDETWDPQAGQQECDQILEDERSERDQREIDDITKRMETTQNREKLEEERDRRRLLEDEEE